MVTQVYIPDLEAYLASSSASMKKDLPLSSDAAPDFKRLLDNAAGRMRKPGQLAGNRDTQYAKADAIINDAVKNGTAKADYLRNDPAGKPAFRTYREIERKESDEKAGAANIPKSEGMARNGSDSATAKSGASDDKADFEAIAEEISGMLGINPQAFMQLLELAGVRPEDITDTAKSDIVLDKLSGILELTGAQEHALAVLINLSGAQSASVAVKHAANSAESSYVEAGAIENDKSEAGHQIGKEALMAGTDAATEAQTSETVVVQETAAQVRMILQELAEKLRDNPRQFIDMVSEKLKEASTGRVAVEPVNSMDSATQNSSVKDSSTGDPATEDITGREGISEADGNKAMQAAQAKEAGNGKNSSEENSSGDGNHDYEAGAVIPEIEQAAMNDTEISNPAAAVIAPDGPIRQDAYVSEPSKIRDNTGIQKQDIISQVIDNAKIMLDGDKSEMILDLKPDALGKLSLKVITERGMVIAKFVAETQQVKEVLEGNMQLLKDSLEKQGFNVQGFSVSVGQDQSGGSGRDKSFGGNAGRAGARLQVLQTTAVSNTGTPERLRSINPYNWSGSSINLTA